MAIFGMSSTLGIRHFFKCQMSCLHVVNKKKKKYVSQELLPQGPFSISSHPCTRVLMFSVRSCS